MSSDAKFKELLGKCLICNDGLVEAIEGRIQGGEDLRAVCNDYEDFQRQLHGEAIYSAAALRARYQRVKGEKAPMAGYSKDGKLIGGASRTTEKHPGLSEEQPLEGFEFRQGESSGSVEYVTEEQKYLNDLAHNLYVFMEGILLQLEEFQKAGFVVPINKVVKTLEKLGKELQEIYGN